MIGELIILGVFFKAFVNNKDGAKEDDKQPPKPLTPEGDDWMIEFEETGADGSTIWCLYQRIGVLYDDGSGSQEWVKVGFIVGNADGTGFLSASSSVGGSITFTIAGTTYKNVLIYADIEAARDATKEEEPSPDSPVKPEEPEEPPSLPPLPVQPDYGLGGFNNWGSF
jgi:hypothetical protein